MRWKPPRPLDPILPHECSAKIVAATRHVKLPKASKGQEYDLYQESIDAVVGGLRWSSAALLIAISGSAKLETIT